MPSYNYQYFCGANVVIELEGFPVLEAVALSVQEQEGKVPLYGYSSRYFDDISRGQVLVQGQLVINYVHEDYLFRALEYARSRNLVGGSQGPDPNEPAAEIAAARIREELYGPLGQVQQRDAIMDEIQAGRTASSDLTEALKERYWRGGDSPADLASRNVPNLHDIDTLMNIKVTFGKRAARNSWSGFTQRTIEGVSFLGRSQTVQIDESTILESYPFLARRIRSSYTGIQERVDEDDNTIIETPDPTQNTPEVGEDGESWLKEAPKDSESNKLELEDMRPFTTVGPIDFTNV